MDVVQTDPREYLSIDLERLDLLLHREVLRLRASYELSLDEFRGLYISDAQVDPTSGRNGRNVNRLASSWKAVFQRRPQNSASEHERAGLRMTGIALMPTLRQTRDSR